MNQVSGAVTIVAYFGVNIGKVFRFWSLGFKVYCPFGTAYRLTGDEHCKDVFLTAARTLSTRFNPNVGAIRSRDHHADVWDFPVIVDNMMNLELLFEATRMTGDSTFHKIAKQPFFLFF